MIFACTSESIAIAGMTVAFLAFIYFMVKR